MSNSVLIRDLDLGRNIYFGEFKSLPIVGDVIQIKPNLEDDKIIYYDIKQITPITQGGKQWLLSCEELKTFNQVPPSLYRTDIEYLKPLENKKLKSLVI